MMTQTHFLVAATLLCSPDRPPRQNIAVLLGAFAPDAAIYGLFIWSKLAGIDERQLWDVIYFSEPMLTYTAIGNSAPLYAMIAIFGFALVKAASTEPQPRPAGMPLGFARFVAPDYTNVFILFALAALTHLAGDLPVHVNDAQPHFWPLTDWRFISPVSYWNSAYHGSTFAVFEAIGGIVLAAILFYRFRAWWVRGLTILLIVGYVAVPAYFWLVLGGG